MAASPLSSRLRYLGAVLYGMLLVGNLLVLSVHAQPPFSSPERPQADAVREEQQRTDSVVGGLEVDTVQTFVEHTGSTGDEIIETLLEIFIFGPILLLVLSLLLAIPATLLGVSLVMDGGCLRYLLFGLGWVFSIFYGLILGAVVGDMILGLGFLVEPIGYAFLWGYPIVAWWTHRTFETMPPEQYRAWDQTLTGGALLGFGAGSVASLVRSAFAVQGGGGGFGGFGGGSFGGGGASGSWSGASAAAGGASSSVGAAGTSSAAVGGAAASTGGTSQAAAISAGAAPGLSSADSSPSSAESAAPQGAWTRLRRGFRKFRWYHGLAFILVTLVFVPLGLGTVQVLQNTKVFVFVLVCVTLYSGYKLLRRPPETVQSAAQSISSFRGGEASSSWS